MNYFQTKFDNDTKWEQAVKEFFFDQDIWMRDMVKRNTPNSAYWRHVGYILQQYDGLVAGYEDIAASDMVSCCDSVTEWKEF